MNLPTTDLAAFLTYAFTMSLTPGPNNAMLATLGARNGFRAAAPAAAGVMFGMFLLLVVAGTGVGAAVLAVPGLKTALTVLGALYMAYLAVVLWRSDAFGSTKEGRPMGFWGALAFQAANPKALLMALTTAGAFLAPGVGMGGAVLLGGLFVGVGTPCVSLWALAGDWLKKLLGSRSGSRLFSRGMAMLVAFTALATLYH